MRRPTPPKIRASPPIELNHPERTGDGQITPLIEEAHWRRRNGPLKVRFECPICSQPHARSECERAERGRPMSAVQKSRFKEKLKERKK